MTYGAATLGGAAYSSTTGDTRTGQATATSDTTTGTQARYAAPTTTTDDSADGGTYGGATFGGAALGSASGGGGTTTATSTAAALADLTAGATATADTQTTLSAITTSAGAAIATADTTTAAATVTSDAAYVEPIVEWRVTRDQTEVIEEVWDVDPVVDTANPFGDYAVFKADDSEGDLFEKFPRGTRVDIAVSTNGGITYENQFTGYTVERRENEQSGADVLEVEAYSFDQFLRRNTVSTDQTGNSIADALESIITNDTPVEYVAANVDVGDEQELTRSYRGVKVETALRDLAFKSNNEEFGVNDDIEFFFRERETVHIDRGIDNTQWFQYDIPELGKETINEVEVWFNDGNSSVVVDDGTDKLDLQDSLGLQDPGTQRAELNRPLITDISDAEDIGRKYLKFRSSTLSGTVTTYGLFDARPGDTIDIAIDSRGIDDEFVIASTEYRWGRDQTRLTIVEQRGDVDDILTELNESVQREEMQGADRDAPKNRITSTNAAAVVSVSADADGNTPAGDRFVNDGRRAVRNAWTGQSPPDIDTLVVGDSNAGLSRSNTALENQTNSATVSQSLPDSTSVEFSASITQPDVRELGLEAADGTLITRLTFDSAVDLDGTVAVTLSVDNDDSVSRGVITNDGQTAVRDILADNSPALPTDYGYGSDDTAVGETDASLGTEVVTVPLDELELASPDTTTEWQNIVDGGSGTVQTDANAPVFVENGALKHAQVLFIQEGEADTITGTRGSGDYSGGEATFIEKGSSIEGQSAELNFELDHTIPESNVAINFRTEPTDGSGDGISDTPRFEVSIDGVSLGTDQLNTTVLDLEWRDFGLGWSGGDLQSGSHTLTIEVVDKETDTGDPDDDGVIEGTVDDELRFDLFAVYDDRFSYNFDNNNDGNGGYLDGPELFPSQSVVDLETQTTRRNFDEARFASTWNDTSNQQYVELSNDGGNSYNRVSNADSGTVTFADPSQSLDTRLALSRYDDGTNATPLQGNAGQEVDLLELFASVDAVRTDDINEALARAIVEPNTINGQTIHEAGLKNGGTLLSRHILAGFTVLQDQRLASSETTAFTSDN